jgi:hypothetical protein
LEIKNWRGQWLTPFLFSSFTSPHPQSFGILCILRKKAEKLIGNPCFHVSRMDCLYLGQRGRITATLQFMPDNAVDFLR